MVKNLNNQIKIIINYFNSGNFNKVLELSNNILRNDPENDFILNLVGLSYQKLQNFYKAENFFIKAIRINPKEKSFELFLAKSLYHSKTNLNYKKSINLLDKYIKNDDFPVDAWHYLGLNYGKLKKLDLSSYAFAEKYLLVNQLDNATIHINRAKQLSNNTVLLNKLSDLEYQINKRKGK